jgi:hypothetical protein
MMYSDSGILFPTLAMPKPLVLLPQNFMWVV